MQCHVNTRRSGALARTNRQRYTLHVPSPVDQTYLHPALTEPHAPPRARVSLVIEAAEQTTAVSLSEGPGLVIGRSEPADIVLDDRSLSRAHARFVLRDGLVHVEDLGSTNGIKLAGERVPSCVLDDTDSVELGAIRVTVSGLGGSVQAGALGGFTRFRQALLGEMERARVFGRPFCLLGLREHRSAGQLGPALAPLLRSVDVATLYTPDLVLVLLPETPSDIGHDLAQRMVKRAGVTAGGAVVSFPADGSDFEELVEATVHGARVAPANEVIRAVRKAVAATSGPVIASPAMQRLYALIDRVARATLPVLVLGETGVGKELVSRAVHDRSARGQGPFVAINCASIPANLIESVLFGHEKGAFTGATERRAGVFEQAHGGSVFLDEVGELAPAVQAALLRVLETKRVTRIGSHKELDVDVRVIAATHRDLPAMVAAGGFREDLMFRLDALSLRVPPLRERVEEIEPLAERFLAKVASEWGNGARRLSREARAMIRAYRWPGNVRQLKNVMERAAVVASGAEIGLEDLPDTLGAAKDHELVVPSPRAAVATFGGIHEEDASAFYVDRVAAFEVKLIREALAKTGGNQTKAAALLRIPRRTLTNKIHALGLSESVASE
jgi:two-component system response regulator AtoC